MKIRLFCAICLVVYIFSACGKGENGGTPTPPDNSDAFKSEMLINYADNIIIPGYNEMVTKLGIFETDANAFLATPDITTQANLKTSFRNAYLSFQNISLAYFGPASSASLNASLNTFPSSLTKLENAIQTGTYDLTLQIVSDSIQGFPALDYLLFSNDAITKFADAGSANRKKFVQDVLTRMKSLSSNVVAQWNNGYRASFIASLKTNVGSSIGYLVNQFAYEMDALKGPRIGWPFGKQSNGIVFADKCEGYYSGISASLAIANLTSLKNYYVGATGKGIADYLVLLKKDQLNNDVLAQFDVALNALKAIPEPMSESFTTNATVVEAAYKEVQKLLTLLKTDVASATAVQITYMDNDGD